MDGLTVDGNDIGCRVDFLAAVAADGAIDSHVPAFAQFLEFPPRPQPVWPRSLSRRIVFAMMPPYNDGILSHWGWYPVRPSRCCVQFMRIMTLRSP